MENNERAFARDTLFVVALILTVAALTFVGLTVWADRADAQPNTSGPHSHRHMRACPDDEGTQPKANRPCVWVGTYDGNQTGRSFRIYRNGDLKYISDNRARNLRGLPYGSSGYAYVTPGDRAGGRS